MGLNGNVYTFRLIDFDFRCDFVLGVRLPPLVAVPAVIICGVQGVVMRYVCVFGAKVHLPTFGDGADDFDREVSLHLFRLRSDRGQAVMVGEINSICLRKVFSRELQCGERLRPMRARF